MLLMSFDATTTLDSARQAYADNISYKREGSYTKCLLFIEACELILAFRPSKMAAGGGSEIEFDQAQVRMLYERACRDAVELNTGGNSVTVPDFNYLRG